MLFSFGKKRRSVRKSSKKGSKPPAKLLKVCKKLRVKATVKRGGKRVYKKKSVLKKLCLRKLRIIKKKKLLLKKKLLAKKKASKKGRKGSRRVKRVRSRMGEAEFGARRVRFGAGSSCGGSYAPSMMSFGRNISFGGQNFGGMEFGKRRKSPKMSKVAAMKAFKAFYRRHCAVRRSRFGNGGNPPLNASMGYEFCPSGMGGVLGASGTGLFPSPCKPLNVAEQKKENGVVLPAYTKPPAGKTSFGKRRRVSRKKVPKTKKGLKKALAKCHKMLKRKVRKY